MATKRQAGDAKCGIGYLRVSTDDQALGVEAQRSAIERWAVAAGVAIVAWFTDSGVSGGSEIADRPGLVAALGELRARHAGVLVVAKRDRVARDTIIAGMIDRAVEQLGARVVAADGCGNGEGPAEAFMRSILDAASAYERGMIRARTRAALAVKKSRGERVGTIAYGFKLAADGVHLEEHPPEQAVIERVRQLRAAGLTLHGVVAELRAAGIVSRKGRPLAVSAVHAIAKAAA